MKNKLYLIIILFMLLPFCNVNEDIPDLQANVEIISFMASPENVKQGESVTLTWDVENAVNVRISGIGVVPAKGSIKVSPFCVTEYVIKAKNDVSSDSETITVDVLSGLL